jgi:hypothetical protein
MNIFSAAKALGGKVTGRDTVSCPGPGHSAVDRSLSVKFDHGAPDGFVLCSQAGDDWQSCKDHVRQLLGIGSFAPHDRRERLPAPSRPVRAPDPAPLQKRAFAASLWNEARPIAGTLVETYLKGRGIDIPGEVYHGDALRFHLACPFRLDSGETGRFPAMLGAMVNIETGELQGVHRTALKADGSGKAEVRGLENPRKMLGSSQGACVRLSTDDAVTDGLGVAEGIETALSVMALGFRPVWSALTANTIRAFPILPGIVSLTVFADNDSERRLPNGKIVRPGPDAAGACALRWRAAGRECTVWMPAAVGSDFNDVGRAAA